MNAATPVGIAFVNKKADEPKPGRLRFPKPENGFELIAEFLRSDTKLRLTPYARLLYLQLADYVGEAKGGTYTCRPSVPTLAKSLGVQERSLRKLIRELEIKGFMRRVHRAKDTGGNYPNLYYLRAAEALVSPVFLDTPSLSVETGSPLSRETGKETSNKKQEERNQHHPLYPPQGGKQVERGSLPAIDDPMCVAIAQVCEVDPCVNQKKIKSMARDFKIIGYTVEHVLDVPECTGWIDYEGQISLTKMENCILNTVDINEQDQFWARSMELERSREAERSRKR